MAASHDNVYWCRFRQLRSRHCGNQSEATIAMHINMPCQAQSLCGGYTDTNTCKTARSDINHDPIRLAIIGQSRDQRKQAFGMAAAYDFIRSGDNILVIKQSD
jgi:hypothetical protein